MNAHSRIQPDLGIDLTAIMHREGIAKIERYPRVFSVVLMDGSLGIAPTVGEALAKAKLPGADNIRRMAA